MFTIARVRSFLLFAAIWSFSLAEQPAEVPVELEAHHNLELQNQYVRVLKVDVPAHQETQIHRHTHDYIAVAIGNHVLTNAVVGSAPVQRAFKDGQVTFIEASGKKSFAHKAINDGNRPLRNYMIEFLRERGPVTTKQVERCAGGGCDLTIATNSQFVCSVRSTEKQWWINTGPYDRPRLVLTLTLARWLPDGESRAKPVAKDTWMWLKPGEKGELGPKFLQCTF
jgi:hypothetical protein